MSVQPGIVMTNPGSNGFEKHCSSMDFRVFLSRNHCATHEKNLIA